MANKFEIIIENAGLTEDEKLLLADTIKHGEWGDCDMEFEEGGKSVTDYAIGFCTNDAYEGGHFERRKLSSMFKKLYKKLPKQYFNHCSDWWDDGSGDMMFIRTPEDKPGEDFNKMMYEWTNEVLNTNK